MTSLFVDQFLIRAYLGECQLAEVAAGTALSGPLRRRVSALAM